MIKSSVFTNQIARIWFLNNQEALFGLFFFCWIQNLAAQMDLFCFTEEDYCLKGVYFAISNSGASFFVLKVSFSMFKLFRPDFEAISLSVREPPLV